LILRKINSFISGFNKFPLNTFAKFSKTLPSHPSLEVAVALPPLFLYRFFKIYPFYSFLNKISYLSFIFIEH